MIGHRMVREFLLGSCGVGEGGDGSPSGGLFGSGRWGEDESSHWKPALKEAHEMLSTKIRTTFIALVASVGFAGAAIAPAVSQAQWHTIVVGGHVITHGNF